MNKVLIAKYYVGIIFKYNDVVHVYNDVVHVYNPSESVIRYEESQFCDKLQSLGAENSGKICE